MRVQELIREDGRVWDVEQLNYFMNPKDVHRALKSSLPPHNVMDRMVWQFDKGGNYVVKSGYKKAYALASDRELEVISRWRLLWGL